MSVATPTLLPKNPRFPHLLPPTPKPYPVPLPREQVEYGHVNAYRDLQREMDDLSEEESELEDISRAIHDRGYAFLVPIGRTLTLQEEKNDADDDDDETDDSASAHSGSPPSAVEGDTADLDASMDDMDEAEENEEDTTEEEASSEP
ncbi:hypothetical protein C8J56DRAFT_276831 [Mycena floridula]|nr:hypothetical protein C8J56DRAFT_276831 [Mycena floridula]